jgi:hypothetical protein
MGRGRAVQPAVAAPVGRCGHKDWIEELQHSGAAISACVAAGVYPGAVSELWVFTCSACGLAWRLLLPDGVPAAPGRAAVVGVRSVSNLVAGTGYISTQARDDVIGAFLLRRSRPVRHRRRAA